jgi:hypothetical protein
MSLILAIEPDPRQSTQLADLVHRRLHAELVHAATTEGALAALATVGDRVPDLVLVPSLLSPQEDAAIAGALRIIATAAKVRMLTIPLLADPEQPPQHRGVFARLRKKPKRTPGGCDPDVFAEQIAAYLAEAAAERKAAREDLLEDAPPAAPQHAIHTSELVPEQASEPEPIVDLKPTVKAAPVLIVQPVVAPLAIRVEDLLVEDVLVAEPAIEEAPLELVRAEEEVVAKAAVDEAASPEPIVEEPPIIVEEPRTEATDREPIVMTVEEPAVAAIEAAETLAETPVSQPVPEAVPEPVLEAVPEPVAEPVLAEEPAETVPSSERRKPLRKRTRKAAAPPAPRREDAIEIDVDIDALIAPLLSEMAAKRAPNAPAAPEASNTLETPDAPSAPIARSAPEPKAEDVDVDPMFFADVPSPLTSAQAERSAWIELVESLRQDIDRLKAERAQPVPPAPIDEVPVSVVARTMSSIRLRPVQQPAATVESVGARLSRVKPKRPVQDQWGLFDPEQCGFAALLAKLDEISAREDVA